MASSGGWRTQSVPGSQHCHPVEVIDDVGIVRPHVLDMFDGVRKLRLPVDKQNANFPLLFTRPLRRKMQHNGGIFSTGKRDADF